MLRCYGCTIGLGFKNRDTRWSRIQQEKVTSESLEVVTRSAQSVKKVIAICHIHGVTGKILSRLHDQKHFLHLPSMLTVV